MFTFTRKKILDKLVLFDNFLDPNSPLKSLSNPYSSITKDLRIKNKSSIGTKNETDGKLVK